MAAFTQYTIADAPEASGPLLQQVDKALGFIPNLYATFAESPALLQGALGLDAGLDKGALSGVERQLVKIAVSTENGCTYCVAAHSTIAGMLQARPEIVNAVRTGVPVSDAKIDALVRFTRAVVRNKGFVQQGETAAFLAAGFTKAQVLEVVSHDLQDLRLCVAGREECRRLSLLNEPLVADDCTGESHEGVDLRVRNGHTGADGIDDFGARLQHPGDRRMRSHAIGAAVFGAHRDLDQLPLDARERALVEPGVEPEGALEQGRRFRKGGVEIGDETEGLVHLLEQGPGRLGGVGDGVLRERCHVAVSSGRRWLPGLVTSKTIYCR